MSGMKWEKSSRDIKASKKVTEEFTAKIDNLKHIRSSANEARYDKNKQKWIQIFGNKYRPNKKNYNFENGKIDVNKVQETLKNMKSSVVDDKEK